MPQALSEETLNQLYRQPRTVNHFTDQEVTDDVLRNIWDLAKMGPTAFNSQPLRVTFLRSQESRERLKPFLLESNQQKTMDAPVTAIMAFDTQWQKRFPEFNARAAEAGMAAMFEDSAQAREGAGLLSASLATGYFITAVRAMGLDAGPMTGADFAGIDGEFFADGSQKSFLVINLGYGVAPDYDRNPRFGFDDATTTL